MWVAVDYWRQTNAVDNVLGRHLACAIVLWSYFVLNKKTTWMAVQYLHVISDHGKTLECE